MSDLILDDQGCYKLWLSGLRSDGKSRYLYGERKAHIAALMELFVQNKVTQDDAEFLKRKVVEALVHEDGMKVTKKEYRGWKENAENDYDDAIQETYVRPYVKTDIKPVRGSQDYDPRIVNWCKTKFGDHVGQDVIKAAHQPLHTFWIMCMEDSFPDYFPRRSS